MAVLPVTLLLAACTSAPPADPRSTPAVLPTSGLEAAARQAVEQGAPAVVFHVRNGSRQDAKAAGVRDLNSNQPAEPGDKLWISGAGTPMVAVSVLKLVENGALRLDDPVMNHLPEFTDIFPAWHRTTIRELLGSRSGLPDYIPSLLESRKVEELQAVSLTIEERLRMAGQIPATPGPLSHAAWSATDWEVLAWLLERVHGRALAEILHSEVFEPAGMSDTLMPEPGPPPEPMLHGYVLQGGNRLDFTRMDAASGSGDAGIISTVEDLNRFFAALTSGRLLSPETWKTIVAGNPYDLGGFQWTDGICPGQRHVFVQGGGNAYNVQSVSSLDGQEQVSVGMALPPADLDPPAMSPLITGMEEVIHTAVRSMCGLR